MVSFAFIKRAPLAFVLRVFALTIILFATIFNVLRLPLQIHRLKQGRVEGLIFEYMRDSGKVQTNSATLESWGVSGEVMILNADREANTNGVFAGDILLNAEALTEGEIGTPVTLYIKHGNLPVREVTLIRRQFESFVPNSTLSDLLGLSPLTRMYLGIIFLCAAVLSTGLFGVAAFLFQSDAWLAFFVAAAITNFFASMHSNPSFLLFWTYFPAGLILFLILFPNCKLDPKWSWILVLLSFSKNISYNALGQANFHIWPDSVYEMSDRYGLLLFLAIAGGFAYRYREVFTSAERRRIMWLFLGLTLTATWRKWFIYLGVSIDFIQKLDGIGLWPHGYIAGLFFESLFGYTGAIVVLPVLGVMVYRYRYTFTPVERQQTKWLVFGLAVSMPPMIVSKIFAAYYFFYGQYDIRDVIERINDRIFLFVLTVFAFSIVSAVRRYRLNDVDTFINYSLVYGGLMITTGAICLSAIMFTDQTIGPMPTDQGAFLIIPISVFLIVITYKPVRIWLQKLTDKYFAPEGLNVAESFFEFTPEMRGGFTLPELSKLLVTKSYKQFGVAYVSVFIKNKNGKLQHINTVLMSGKMPKLSIEPQELSKLERGELVQDIDLAYSIIVPLILSRGQKPDFIGALVLGPRLNGLGYSTNMKNSLIGFGQEIGKALYIARIQDQKRKTY